MSHDSSKVIAFNYFGGKFTWLNYLYDHFPMEFKEKINIDRFESFRLTLSAAMYFGTQYESISPEKLLIGKLHTA